MSGFRYDVWVSKALPKKERDHRQGRDPTDIGIPSCRQPLMYVWFNWPIITACDLEMDLRSLFHLNHSVGIPYSTFVPSFVVTPLFRKRRDQSVYDAGQFFFWLPQRGILHIHFSWFHFPTNVLATLCHSSDNRTEMLSTFFYPSFNYASCKKYFPTPYFDTIFSAAMVYWV